MSELLDFWVMSSAACFYLAGFFNGAMDSLTFRYGSYKWHPMGTDTFLGKDEQYWNPAKSWTNKYKDGNPGNGAAFFLSTTWLVWLTDGWHQVKFLMLRCLNIAPILLMFWQPQVIHWWHIPTMFAIFFLTFPVGFHTVYTFTKI